MMVEQLPRNPQSTIYFSPIFLKHDKMHSRHLYTPIYKRQFCINGFNMQKKTRTGV